MNKPKLLLHSCCAPCSSSVLERLATAYDITIYYYNPNIDTKIEFLRRAEELQKLKALQIPHKVITEPYNPTEYNQAVQGLETLGEGSARCYACYSLRLEKTAQYAKAHNFDIFTTTLSVSPHKNAVWLAEIGEKISKKYQIPYLAEDFKKKDGYKRSLDLSQQLNLYRQTYCGCKYSKSESALSRNYPRPRGVKNQIIKTNTP
jgi:predicted adenine nucleotide alpha hydrolase (AANH) superfamily ATPase